MTFSGSGQSRVPFSQGMLGSWVSEVSHQLSKAAVPQLRTRSGLGTGELIVKDLEEGLPTRGSSPQWVPQGHKDLWPPLCRERARKGTGNPMHRTDVFTGWVPAQALGLHNVVPLGEGGVV